MQALVKSAPGVGEVDCLVRLRDGVPTVTSLVIAREFGRRHDNVLRTLDSLIKDETIDRLNFEETSYTDDMNRAQRMIELDEAAALIAVPFIGGRNSRLGQKRLVHAFFAMRKQLQAVALEAQKKAASAPMPKSPVGDLALAESIGRVLNVSQSGRVALLRHVAKSHGLDETLLPAYVVDAPSDAASGSSEATAPISRLLTDSGVRLSPSRFNQLLQFAGLLEKRTRRTTQKRFQSGEKHFWVIAPAGLRFGKNLIDTHSPRETVPHWYVGRFAELRAHLRPIYLRMQAGEAL